MNKFLFTTIALVSLFCGSLTAQAPKKRTPRKHKKSVAAKEIVIPADYEIHVVTANGVGVILVQIVPVPSYPSLEAPFTGFLRDHFAARPNVLNVKYGYPKIVVKFLDTDDILTLVGAVQLVRISDKAVVELDSMLDDVRLMVPRKPTPQDMIDVKPNPLTLLVEMTEQKSLTLNNEEMGTLSDTATLVKFLKEVFRERENNGVFRENSNEVEKTVFIKMPLSGKAADMITIAKALQEAGSDIIGFQVDDLDIERKDLDLFLPRGPEPKSKNFK